MHYDQKAEAVVNMKVFQIDFDSMMKVLLYIPDNKLYYAEYFQKEYGEHFSQLCFDKGMINDEDFDIFVYVDTMMQAEGCKKYRRLIGKVFPLTYAWGFRDGNHRKVNLYYRSNYFRYFLRSYLPINLHTFLLEPLMYYIGLLRGFTLLHAASADNHGQGLVISAQSGCGKTSTVFKLIRSGCGFLGDDLVWVSEKGDLLRYPRLIHLFSYVLQYSSFLTLPWKLHIYLKVKDFLRQIIEFVIGEQFNIATRVDIKDLMNSVNIVNRTVLTGFFFMRKEYDVLVESIDDSNRLAIIDSIMEVNEPMDNLFKNFFEDDESLRITVRKRQEKLLNTILHNSKAFMINRELVKTEVEPLLWLLDNE